jgi:hypothetical protein
MAVLSPPEKRTHGGKLIRPTSAGLVSSMDQKSKAELEEGLSKVESSSRVDRGSCALKPVDGNQQL